MPAALTIPVDDPAGVVPGAGVVALLLADGVALGKGPVQERQ
jgi:hypothetical protein